MFGQNCSWLNLGVGLLCASAERCWFFLSSIKEPVYIFTASKRYPFQMESSATFNIGRGVASQTALLPLPLPLPLPPPSTSLARETGQTLADFHFPSPSPRQDTQGLLVSPDHQSPILEILWDPLVPSKIYIVHQNSSTQCWEYRQADCRWMRRCVFQLSNAKGVEIVSIVFHSSIGQLFWCERRSSAASAHFCCCVCMRDVPHDWSDGMASRLGPVHAILHGCPAVSLFVLKKGICLAPILPEEKLTLLLFWTFVHRALKVRNALPVNQGSH